MNFDGRECDFTVDQYFFNLRKDHVLAGFKLKSYKISCFTLVTFFTCWYIGHCDNYFQVDIGDLIIPCLALLRESYLSNNETDVEVSEKYHKK